MTASRATSSAAAEGRRVLEENERFAGGHPGEIAVRVAIVHLVRNRGERDPMGRVEHAEAKACAKEAADAPIDVAFVQQPLGDRGRNVRVRAAAVEIAAGANGEGGRLLGRARHAVRLVKITDGPAVADDIAIEAPLAPQDAHQERGLPEHGSPFVRL